MNVSETILKLTECISNKRSQKLKESFRFSPMHLPRFRFYFGIWTKICEKINHQAKN